MLPLLEAEITRLLEVGYDTQQLWRGIDFSFIHMSQHFDAIRDMGVKYEATQYDIVRFTTASESRPGQLRHQVWIQMAELGDVINDPNYKMYDKIRMAMTASLRTHCDCEAFLYFGYKYILTQLDTAIEPENRPPKVRNPKMRGTVCKHIAAVLKVFPFWISTIVGELQKQGLDNYQAATVAVATREPAPAAAAEPAAAPQAQPTAQPAAQQVQPQPSIVQVTAPKKSKKKKSKTKKKSKKSPGESIEGISFWQMVEADIAESALA